MIQDVKGILPPNQFTQGNPYAFLQDIKNAGSYTENKDSRGTEFQVSALDVYGRLLERNQSNSDYPTVKHPAEEDQHTLWGLMETIITACKDGSNPNPACYVALNYMWVEADIEILDDIIPDSVRLSDGETTFQNFTMIGDSEPDEIKSIDNSKVLFRCHLGGGIIDMEELSAWIDYAKTSDKNIRLLTHFERNHLLASSAYTIQ